MRIQQISMMFVGMLLTHPALAQIPCHYEVAAVIQAPSCGITGVPPTIGTGISPNGQYVCGFYYQCPGSAGYKAFVYKVRTGQFITLPFPPGVVSAYANDVNDSGLVVGQYEDSIKAGYRGFVYDLNAGQYVLEVPPEPDGAWSEATAINNNGEVCGWRSVGSKGDPVNPYEAFIWTARSDIVNLKSVPGTYSIAARALNENGAVVGTTRSDGLTQPFLWQDGAAILLGTLAGMDTEAFAISNLNQVVGSSRVPLQGAPFGASHAILWTSGRGMLDLGMLPGHNSSSASDINNTGTLIVGASRLLPAFNTNLACVWGEGVVLNLNDLVTPPLNDVLYSANAIDDAGDILAIALDEITYLLSPTGSSPADIDFNCRVDVDDLLLVLNEWGKRESPADINHDQIVNAFDLLMVLDQWNL